MKNVVVTTMIIPKDKELDKFGGWEWMNISKTAWEFWCDKNGYEFVVYDSPSIEDTTKFRITVQRWFDIFDFLDKKNIEYDQIALVDACSIPKWDCPDFFQLTNNKFTVGQENDNLRWIHESVQGYKDVFNNYELDISKYFCAQFVIFNKSHKELFMKFKENYLENVEEFIHLQKTVRRGTDQTPFNYIVQMNDTEVTYLPKPYRLSHLNRKEMFSHNWQLNEDLTPFFIKYGYIWFFSGFDKTIRNKLMGQAWDLIRNNYDKNFFINKVNSKHMYKNTTSYKFKEDIYRIFSEPRFKNMTLLELGSHHGDTTRVYAECFGKVIAVDRGEDNIKKIKEKCKDVSNVECIRADVYDKNFELPKADVIHIDAGHTYESVVYDIDRCINQMNNPILIFDDYGHEGRNVGDAVNDELDAGKLQLWVHIGEGVGYIAANDKVFIGREGVICNV